MSHVASIDVEINDLNALHLAANRLGLVLDTAATSYRWYGKHVGDYPLPEGISVEQLGKCHSKLTIPGDAECYEVGVVCVRPGSPGVPTLYRLLWDFWGPRGARMKERIGENGEKLKHAYAVERAKIAGRVSGHQVREVARPDGSTVIELVKIQRAGR